jgi:RimJ/RimL family protein N-acetyltransferase
VIDIRNYEACEQLKDGRKVFLRTVRPEDRKYLVEGFRHFSQASVYKRFHGPKDSLSDEELKFFTEIDYLYHVALLAVLKDDGEQPVGGGRYIVYNEALPPRYAEIAFAVADSFQGLGVATIILKHLIVIAREEGIETFEAEVLAVNRGMIRVFEKTNLQMTKTYEGSNVHITLAL